MKEALKEWCLEKGERATSGGPWSLIELTTIPMLMVTTTLTTTMAVLPE
ncbi:MAG: hypothetical protein AAB868_02860 [Patescibacteria group bacterium]